MRWLALFSGLLLAGAARADMFPDAANAKLPEARANLGVPLDLIDLGAVCDGTHRALSTRYGTLAEAQAVYPFVTALTQGIDWAAAQQAVNALPRVAKVRGQCTLAEPLVLPSNATISGVTEADGFIAVSGFAPAGNATGMLTMAAGAADITIRSLKLNAAGFAGNGIYRDGSGGANRTRIQDNWILSPTDSGIYVRSAQDTKITGNSIDTPGLHCVTLTTSASDFIVSGNTCNNPGGAGVIFMVGIRGVITGNRILAAGPAGDGVTGYATTCEDVVISNNVITDATNHGIHVAGNRISITGNIIENTNNTGIMFGGNTGGTSSADGIYTPSVQNNISNNIIRNPAGPTHAITVIKLYDSVIAGNVVSGPGATHAGLYMRESDRNTVSGNVVQDGGLGFFLEGVGRNVFTGNFSHNNAGYGYRITDYAATPAYSTYNTFTGNVSDTDTLQGFSEAGSSANNVFSNNRIVNNATSPYMTKASATTLVNNVPLFTFANYDPPSLAVDATATTTIAVPGAVLGDRAEVSVQSYTDMTISAIVSAVDTVQVKVWNNTGGVRDMSSSAFFVWVWQK